MIFLGGDVMTGRGIDQLFSSSSDPRLQERYVKDARDYLTFAEEVNGPIPRPVARSYPWGDALEALDRLAPQARILNIETSITRSDDFWPNKGIHYRMHPENLGCLQAIAPDVCVLANNHVLDFGYAGLQETLSTLSTARLKTAGAGLTLAQALQPAQIPLGPNANLFVFAFGTTSSGVFEEWAATRERPGVCLLPDLSDTTAAAVLEGVRRVKRPQNLVIASIHWGENWGYEVPLSHQRFAHWLVEGGVDIVHGHSSHHAKPIEVYQERLILYGCGDLLNDYEGIGGHKAFRGELALMYFATVEAETGALCALRMLPMQRRQCRLRYASAKDTRWLQNTLSQSSEEFGSRIELTQDGSLWLRWGARLAPKAPPY